MDEIIEDLEDLFNEYYNDISQRLNEINNRFINLRNNEAKELIRFIFIIIFFYMIKDLLFWILDKFKNLIK
tara:strand:- start:318 stop:530 length:213 start_codon:yes stop_codon:yes gene_type:complete